MQRRPRVDHGPKHDVDARIPDADPGSDRGDGPNDRWSSAARLRRAPGHVQTEVKCMSLLLETTLDFQSPITEAKTSSATRTRRDPERRPDDAPPASQPSPPPRRGRDPPAPRGAPRRLHRRRSLRGTGAEARTPEGRDPRGDRRGLERGRLAVPAPGAGPAAKRGFTR